MDNKEQEERREEMRAIIIFLITAVLCILLAIDSKAQFLTNDKGEKEGFFSFAVGTNVNMFPEGQAVEPGDLLYWKFAYLRNNFHMFVSNETQLFEGAVAASYTVNASINQSIKNSRYHAMIGLDLKQVRIVLDSAVSNVGEKETIEITMPYLAGSYIILDEQVTVVASPFIGWGYSETNRYEINSMTYGIFFKINYKTLYVGSSVYAYHNAPDLVNINIAYSFNLSDAVFKKKNE